MFNLLTTKCLSLTPIECTFYKFFTFILFFLWTGGLCLSSQPHLGRKGLGEWWWIFPHLLFNSYHCCYVVVVVVVVVLLLSLLLFLFAVVVVFVVVVVVVVVVIILLLLMLLCLPQAKYNNTGNKISNKTTANFKKQIQEKRKIK